MSDRERIVIGAEEFLTEPEPPPIQAPSPPAPQPPAPAVRGGAQLPPVGRQESVPVGAGDIGKPSANGSGVDLLSNPRLAPIVAGLGAMAVAWFLSEVLGVPAWGDSWSGEAGLAASTGLYFAFVGMIFGSAMLTYDRLFAGAYEDALRRAGIAAGPMFGIAFVAGVAAQLIYSGLLGSEGSLGASEVQIYVARILAWSLFGLGIGAAGGLLSRSINRAINGAIGGAIGGAVGGLLFQAIAESSGAGSGVSRLFGLLSIAVLIALSTHLVEQARRDAWLSVVSGGMSGKEFIIYHDRTRVGASPACEIYLLKDPSVAKTHAWIDDAAGQRTLNAVEGCVVFVDGRPIARHVLRDRNQIQIGNTLILYSERALALEARALA